MKRLTLVFLLLTFCATAFAGESQLQKATNVLNEIMSTPDKGIPHDLLDKAVCVGIVPAEIKFAFGFGATYGRGVLVCRRGGDGRWDAPSMFTLGGASVGFQIGGSDTDLILLVMNRRGMEKLLSDKVTLGAGASVAAGPVGRSANVETDVEMHAEMLAWSRSKGLFAGVALNGATLRPDRNRDAELYGRRTGTREILMGNMAPPPAARPLIAELDRYSMRSNSADRVAH